jgi:hypothetical protein
MRRRNSTFFERKTGLSFKPDAFSIKRVMEALKALPKEIGEKVLRSAAKKWGRNMVMRMRPLVPRGHQKQQRLWKSLISSTKVYKKKGAFLVYTMVGTHFDPSATRRTGGAGWRFFFTEQGSHAYPKGLKNPTGKGPAWRKGIRNRKGVLRPGKKILLGVASTAAATWEKAIIDDVQAVIKEKQANG